MKTRNSTKNKKVTGDKKMKVVILPLFPRVQRKDFEFIGEYIKNNSAHPITNLPLILDKGKYNSWKAYYQHLVELDKMKEAHIKCIQRHQKTEHLNDSTIQSIDYPDTKHVKILSELKENDILMLHSHGNTSEIGAGPFVLPPKELAQNMKSMGLPLTNPPAIIVWACHSGSSDGEQKSYAENLYNELIAIGFVHPIVAGIAAEIRVNTSRSYDIAMFTNKHITPRGAARDVRVRPDQAVTLAASPSLTSSSLFAKNKEKAGPLTLCIKAAFARTSNNLSISIEAEGIKSNLLGAFDDASNDSTLEESDHNSPSSKL